MKHKDNIEDFPLFDRKRTQYSQYGGSVGGLGKFSVRSGILSRLESHCGGEILRALLLAAAGAQKPSASLIGSRDSPGPIAARLSKHRLVGAE